MRGWSATARFQGLRSPCHRAGHRDGAGTLAMMRTFSPPVDGTAYNDAVATHKLRTIRRRLAEGQTRPPFPTASCCSSTGTTARCSTAACWRWTCAAARRPSGSRGKTYGATPCGFVDHRGQWRGIINSLAHRCPGRDGNPGGPARPLRSFRAGRALAGPQSGLVAVRRTRTQRRPAV